MEAGQPQAGSMLIDATVLGHMLVFFVDLARYAAWGWGAAPVPVRMRLSACLACQLVRPHCASFFYPLSH